MGKPPKIVYCLSEQFCFDNLKDQSSADGYLKPDKLEMYYTTHTLLGYKTLMWSNKNNFYGFHLGEYIFLHFVYESPNI